MNRRRADIAAGILLGAMLLLGGGLTWNATRRRTGDGTMGSMMDASMGSMHGPDPLWYALGTLVIAAVLGGLYLLVRPDFEAGEAETRPGQAGTQPDQPQATPASEDATETDRQSPTGDRAGRSTNADAVDGQATAPEANPTERVLDLLPEDERRVLEPVLESPGITQIELRDRSSFSKSKVSQTVGDLEERGLLYRERQGRTYRIYPSEELGSNRES